MFALPDVARPRERVAEGASILNIVGSEGEWYRVEWDDSQSGRRIGYIEKRFVGEQAAAAQ
jgi:hypothetical protein